MRVGYTGLDNIAHKIDKIYVGENNIAHRCVRGYVGVNNKATLIYPVDQDVPTVSGHYTYDREVHEAIISNYDEDMIAVSGTTKTANAGVYTITFTLKSSMYRWTDGTSTPKTATWAIDKKVVGIPSIIPGTYVYNGSVQSASFTAYDPYAVAITGEPMAADAGTHYVYFNLTSTNNYMWSDGTVEEKTDSWAISPLIVACPTVAGNYVYNGKSQAVEISAYDHSIVSASGNLSATNAGNYAVIFSLIDPINYRWTDNTTANKSIPWAIAKAMLAVPTLTGTYTYNGKTQTVTTSRYDETLIQKGGETSAINVGTYYVTFNLIISSNYQWTDSTTTQKSVPWSIAKQAVTIPGVSANLIYNGNDQHPTISNINYSIVVVSGTQSATNAGTYTIKFNLIDAKTYMWSDGSVTEKSATWAIQKKSLVVPTLSGGPFTYNGSEQSVVISKYDTTLIQQTGTTKATNAGTYTVYFNLYASVVSNYQWADGTITQKNATWSIAKATPSLWIDLRSAGDLQHWAYAIATSAVVTFSLTLSCSAVTKTANSSYKYDTNIAEIHIYGSDVKKAGTYTCTATAVTNATQNYNSRTMTITKDIYIS